MKNIIILVLQICSAAAGLYAAYWWWVASTGRIESVWDVEPGESELSQAGWITGIMNSLGESARLNKRAALWTALTVLFSAICGILGALTSFVR